MHKLRYAPEAANDLEEIRDYIAQELMNPDAAEHTLEEIAKRLRLLCQQPLLGKRLTYGTGIETDERFLVCGRYLAFYHVFQDAVLVDRILYNKRNYQALLLETKTH